LLVVRNSLIYLIFFSQPLTSQSAQYFLAIKGADDKEKASDARGADFEE
jgi:hypothetical protein